MILNWNIKILMLRFSHTFFAALRQQLGVFYYLFSFSILNIMKNQYPFSVNVLYPLFCFNIHNTHSYTCYVYKNFQYTLDIRGP